VTSRCVIVIYWISLRTVGAVILVGTFASASAQSGSPAAPAFKSLRYEEDYRALRDPALRGEWTDNLKALPLPGLPDGLLNLGGDVRLRYEQFHNAQWGQGPQDENGYILQRFMLHADVHADDKLRVFLQLKSGIEAGRTGGPRATDEDRIDLHQAFVDYDFTAAGGTRTMLRIGRQELALGSSRLVSFREGPNVRLSFDGVRGTSWRGGWKLDYFGLAPVQTDPGSFDDRSDPAQRLWGAYATGKLSSVPGSFDFYYLGLRRDFARFAQGVTKEVRHSIGVRWWGTLGNWDYNMEAVAQGGRFGSDAIQAWTLASDTGYTFADTVGTPRASLKVNVASGDRDPQRSPLQTFNPMFPRGAYFNESGLIGPANFVDLHPAITVNPASTLSLTVDADFFWRQSTRDGLYGPALNLLRPPGRAHGARYIGAQTGIFGTWKPERHWNITAGYAHFFAGAYLHENAPGDDVDYVTTWVAYTF
jgi:hypothetical protein